VAMKNSTAERMYGRKTYRCLSVNERTMSYKVFTGYDIYRNLYCICLN
jgi:hypothetical protein